MSTSPPSENLAPAFHTDVKQVVDIKSDDSPDLNANQVAISSISKDEPLVTRRELWSYYLYSNGGNGVGLGYTQTLFQGLATAAGYDPVAGPGSSCLADTASGQCIVPWGSGTKSVSSVVLTADGISFAIMTAILTTIGSAADYGTFGRWLLFAITVVCWAAQYACMALTTPNRWVLAMVLYIIGFVSYSVTLVFYAALFPRLARNTSRARQFREKYENGEIPPEVYEQEESLEKNRITDVFTVHSNVGFVTTLLLNLALLLPMANNPKVDNYVIVVVNTYWVVLGIWWFVFQEPRPGPELPKGEYYLTIGWKQIWAALKTYKHLPYTFVYLFSYFLLADGLNTTGTLVSVCQNDKFSFSFLQNTYLGLSQAITSTISTLAFWYVQRYWKISTKKMVCIATLSCSLYLTANGTVCGHECCHDFDSAMGYDRNMDRKTRVPQRMGVLVCQDSAFILFCFYIIIRAYNVMFGLFQAPYYAYSLTMMSELSPPGFENMFFGLFGLSNRASSMVGPNVIQVIIDKTGNNWQGFPFLFAMCTAASVVIWFGVDITKGRRDAVRWAAEQRRHIQ
ncbi:autophagy-related protein 22-like protein [Suillus subalutaceus]|uniref:autophagy-related protein 22-like protein n=1 Tax=Suillus subalutaceus TaxID=48586 RepID=UPI001B869C4E|nr:autophagy-related protein 22-like protein [Suillus subalutaceus]KAG1873634.1 autophagy-related protein 22-like protein [Suillus subalutaceus]